MLLWPAPAAGVTRDLRTRAPRPQVLPGAGRSTGVRMAAAVARAIAAAAAMLASRPHERWPSRRRLPQSRPPAEACSPRTYWQDSRLRKTEVDCRADTVATQARCRLRHGICLECLPALPLRRRVQRPLCVRLLPAAAASESAWQAVPGAGLAAAPAASAARSGLKTPLLTGFRIYEYFHTEQDIMVKT